MLTLALLISAFMVSGLLSWWLSRARGRWQTLDTPNERSLHTRPVPRTGGLAMLLGAAPGLLVLWFWQDLQVAGWPLYAAVVTLALTALVDDRRNLGAGLRLLVQIGVVALLLFHYRPADLGLALTVAALLFLVWMINLYNFMDGMDGFAAGMAIIGFGTFAVLAWQAGQPDFALGCALLVAASAGFLVINFPPARLFMGDVGSTVLGLLAGVVILKAHLAEFLPLWLGILVFSPFIVDASVTLVRRILQREAFWLPHKSHYYQRLVESGWGHRRTVLAEYALMLACSGSALFAATRPAPGQWLILAAWALIYGILIFRLNKIKVKIGAASLS